MSADSLIPALILFAACMGGWHLAAGFKGAGRLHVRFAAVLLAALAVCVPLGMGDVAGLFLLPLAGAVLGLGLAEASGLRVPDLVAAPGLALALGLGLGGALTDQIMLSLLPVAVLALAVLGVALSMGSLVAVLGALALGMAVPAFAGQGAGGGVLLLLAAALVGLVRGCRKRAAVPGLLVLPAQQVSAGSMRAVIGTGRRQMAGRGRPLLRQHLAQKLRHKSG